MGTIWASCPGSSLSGFRVDRGGWNSRQTCRSTETELPWVLGASYPPLLLPFLQLYDLSKLQVVCSSLGCTLCFRLNSLPPPPWVLDSCGPPGLLVWGLLPPQCPSMQRWGQTGQDGPWVSTKAWVFTQSPTDTQTIASVHGNLVPGTASPLQ